MRKRPDRSGTHRIKQFSLSLSPHTSSSFLESRKSGNSPSSSSSLPLQQSQSCRNAPSPPSSLPPLHFLLLCVWGGALLVCFQFCPFSLLFFCVARMEGRGAERKIEDAAAKGPYPRRSKLFCWKIMASTAWLSVPSLNYLRTDLQLLTHLRHCD